MSATIETSTQCAAIVSMLHEQPNVNSATRRLAGRTVLHRTLSRLARASKLDQAFVICWDDQLTAVQTESRVIEATVHSLGARRSMPALDAVTVARRWSDGWRGNLLGSCSFDRGFDAKTLLELTRRHSIDLAVVVDPASALIDWQLVESAIGQAQSLEDQPMIFSAATPGANATVLRQSFIETLGKATTHPGLIVTYRPDRPILDPTGSSACQRVPPRISRTTINLLVESHRVVSRLERVFSSTELDSIPIEQAIERLESIDEIDDQPRDVLLELNTNRLSTPIDRPTDIARNPISLSQVESLLKELGRIDDIRLTLAGLGDPILHPQFAEVIRCAKHNGVRAICIETDLLGTDHSIIDQLADAGVDIVSVNIPATSSQVYQRMMGVDGFETMLNNVRRLVTLRGARGSMLPLVVPVFVKTRENLHEMEAWYDQWITALGSATIRGPSDFGGLIENLEVADMRPPCRTNCSRLSRRISVLCDGRLVPCEEDVKGRQAIGTIGQTTLVSAWKSLDVLRSAHREGDVSRLVVCSGCRQWHRP